MRRFGTRRGTYISTPLLVLPAVGPFASNGVVYAVDQESTIITIPDYTFGTSVSFPQKYNVLQFTSSGSLGDSQYGIFIWANRVVLKAGVSASFRGNGGFGTSANILTLSGGNGGFGATGGGGGAATTSKAVVGGRGGFAAGSYSGTSGASNGGGSGGVAGVGYANLWTSAYTWGNGANGEAGGGGANAGAAGTGGNGYGGAGGGGGVAAGAGGSGAGNGGSALICVIANECSGGGVFDASADSLATTGYGIGTVGGRAGAGVVWVAFKKYDGTATADVTGPTGNGTKSIYEITRTGSLVSRLFSDSWNNL